ncbi:MAG: hypothetical protein IJJ40_02195 [Clostridia bacterium]|nr:hypothetical protein [Clostridia bacterium]
MKIFEKIKKHYSGFREKTKGMSFSQFVLFIKDYYLKDFLALVAVLAVIITVIVTSVVNINTDIILYGTGVNLMLTDEGEKYITDDFFELHKTGGRQKIEYSTVVVSDIYSGEGDINATYYSIEGVIAQVAAKRLDYMLLNELGFNCFATQELYMDLREILTDEEMEEYKDRIIYTKEEEAEEMLPMAIDITDTEFIKKNNIANEKIYIAFAGNAPHKELAYEFFHYILAYK